MDLLDWLQNWCIDNLSEKSLNSRIVTIDNLDNPGWTIEINLTGTMFENKKFVPIKLDRTEHDWFYCRIENQVFHGSGGPCNLGDLLDTFRNWASESEQVPLGIIKWMQEWYLKHCDEYWEEYYGFRIERTNDSEWSVKVDIQETELEGKSFIEDKVRVDESNWFHCWASIECFYGKGGTKNLINILSAFREWAIAN